MSFTLFFLTLLVSAYASDDALITDDVVVKSSRIELDQQAGKSIDVRSTTAASRPTLETALKGQSNIQVTPSITRGTNLSLDGLNGEQVAVFQDGDPVLGRLDGALDSRMIALDGVDRVAVYQGFDSLKYGSQNVAGTISLESPWEQPRQARLRSAGGNYGRTLVSGQASTPVEGLRAKPLNLSAAASNWRSNAIWAAPDSVDTSADAYANLSTAAQASQLELFTVGGRAVDARVGGTGFHQESSGIFAGDAAVDKQTRVHVFSDFRREKSVFHAAYSDYKDDYVSATGLNQFSERAFRFGPDVQENFGNVVLFAGSTADVHSTKTSRIPGNGEIDSVRVGSYVGARYAFSDHWVAGTGTRWDSAPHLWSPRAEIRHLGRVGVVEHSTVLESGFGFREATPKEQYLYFPNPALRYVIVGNPDLHHERSWITALRHTAETKRVTVRASVFEMRVRDAISTSIVASPTASSTAFTYANLNRTFTRGAHLGGEYRFAADWSAGAQVQWLLGRNLDGNSSLPLQPKQRVSFLLGRNVERGLGVVGQAVWSSRQAFGDLNRNGVIEASEWAPPYWAANLEAGYGFNWPGVAELVRIFGRVDNAFDVVHAETFPLEPRTFLMGAMVQL